MWWLVAAALAAEPVELVAADGTRLHAIAELARGARRGVVLVHQEGRSSGDWTYLAGRLARSGIAVVAPDLRGHGESAPGIEITDESWLEMVVDVRAAADWLRAHGVEEVSCAGAAIGANLCLRAAAEDPGIVNLVLLSPGLNYHGVKTGDAIEAYGTRPALFVASQEDTYAARSAELLEEHARGQSHLELLDGAGRGTKMLNRAPRLEGIVLSWLLGTYQLADGSVVQPARDLKVEPGQVETTGRKLDAHR